MTQQTTINERYKGLASLFRRILCPDLTADDLEEGMKEALSFFDGLEIDILIGMVQAVENEVLCVLVIIELDSMNVAY